MSALDALSEFDLSNVSHHLYQAVVYNTTCFHFCINGSSLVTQVCLVCSWNKDYFMRLLIRILRCIFYLVW